MMMINLERIKAACHVMVDKRLLTLAQDPEIILREEMDAMLMGMQVSFFGREAHEDIEYPDGWVQAFRDRFWPKWAKKRWPIRMASKRVEAKQLFAGLPAIPQYQQHYTIAVAEGPVSWRKPNESVMV